MYTWADARLPESRGLYIDLRWLILTLQAKSRSQKLAGRVQSGRRPHSQDSSVLYRALTVNLDIAGEAVGRDALKLCML